MRGLSRRLTCASCAAALGLAAGVVSLSTKPGIAAGPEGWQALVIGQPGRGAEGAFAASFHASNSLTNAGFAAVTMLRDKDVATTRAAISSLSGAPDVLIYYAGPTKDSGRAIAPRGGSLNLQTLLNGLAAGGARQIALLIEDCPSPHADAQNMADVTAPEGVYLLVAASAGPNGSCPDVGARLTDHLGGAGDTLAGQLSTFWTQGALREPLTMAASSAPVLITPASANTGESAPRVIANDVVAIAPITTPIRPTKALEPIRAAQPAARAGAGEAVVIFAPPANSQLAAEPTAQGLPEPSIIVGIIEGATEFDRAPDESAVNSNELSYDNLEARNALKDQDPDLFASLVEGGAFDPPPAQMARALQTELSRMGCYTAAIDGDWGRGSRAAVQRYFDELEDVVPASLEPVAALFRQLILGDEVECAAPAPVAQTAARNTSTRNTSTRNTASSTRTSTPTRSAPKPQATTPKRTIQSGTRLGVFR
ncbi:MAG: peptidoglycan-binding domain-containing protein [Maritimibacter sp.]